MAGKMLNCPSLLAFSMKRRGPGKGGGGGCGGVGVPVATRGEPVVDAVVLVPGHAVLCDGAGRGKAVEGGGNRTTGSYLRVGGGGGVGEGRDAEVEPGVGAVFVEGGLCVDVGVQGRVDDAGEGGNEAARAAAMAADLTFGGKGEERCAGGWHRVSPERTSRVQWPNRGLYRVVRRS